MLKQFIDINFEQPSSYVTKTYYYAGALWHLPWRLGKREVSSSGQGAAKGQASGISGGVSIKIQYNMLYSYTIYREQVFYS